MRLTTALKLHDPVSKNNFDFGWFCYDKENWINEDMKFQSDVLIDQKGAQ